MEFRLLGPLEIVERDRALILGAGKQRALLAILLLNANEVVSTDRLHDDLWGESPPATAAKSIQMYVSRLRKELGDGRLVTRPPGYLLRVEPQELDAARFRRLVGEARNAEPERAGRRLREALALWRGPPLADLEYEPFAQAEISRLREARLSALEQRVDADLAAGRHRELVGELEALVAEHPLRERLWAQLMLALYRSARQAEALETYRAARRSLSDELGLEPGSELRQLEQAILRQDPELDLARPAAARPQPSAAAPERSVLVFPGDLGDLPSLLELGEALAGTSRELVIAAVVGAGELQAATADLATRRDELRGRGVPARAAAFTSPSPGDDVVRFVFASESGLITGWSPSVLPESTVPAFRRDGAVFKGLALANTPSGPLLFATDFHHGEIVVLDGSFDQVTLPGGFSDPAIPAGFAPFGIKTLGGLIYVTYAKQDGTAEDDVAGRGNGFVNVFDTAGNLVRRLAAGDPLNSPWGIALAPADFGDASGALLIGNVGDGRINAFDPVSGEFLGALRSDRGQRVEIDGLRALEFGNGVTIGSRQTLFFTAGIADGAHGLFGALTPATPG